MINYQMPTFNFDRENDFTEEELRRAYLPWLLDCTPKGAFRWLPQEDRELIENFEQAHLLPTPPWDDRLFRREARLIKKACDGFSPKRHLAIHVTWLSARYNCEPAHVLETIAAEFNRSSTAWAAFNFRFSEGYRFNHSLFPQTGEVRLAKWFLSPSGKPLERGAAEAVGKTPMYAEKHLIRANVEGLKPTPLRSRPPTFISEAAREFEKLKQTPERMKRIETGLCDRKERRLEEPGQMQALDGLRLSLWNLLLDEAFGSGSQTARLLIPPGTAISFIESFLGKNRDLRCLLYHISKTGSR